jgi:stage V sporulation protein B
VFYSLSTVTNAVLQGIGKVNAPVLNALAALVLQSAALIVLLLHTSLGDVALCIVTIIYSMMMCLLNNFVMKRHLPIKNDLKKTYLYPVVSSAVMGGTAFGIHKLFSLIFKQFVGSEYFVNLFSTLVAVLFAVFIYFVVLIKSGGASEEDIKRFPKGTSIVSLLKKIRVL